MNRMRLAFRLAWRDIQNHKARTSFAVVLFSLPLLFILGLSSGINLGLDHRPHYNSNEPISIAWITNYACAEMDEVDDSADCISRNDVEKLTQTPDLERIQTALGDDAKLAASFRPEFQFSAEVKGTSDETALPVINVLQPGTHRNETKLPNPGEIILNEETSFITGAGVGDQVTMTHGNRSVKLRVADISSAYTNLIHIENVPFEVPDYKDIISEEFSSRAAVLWVSGEVVNHRPNKQGIDFQSTDEHQVITDPVLFDVVAGGMNATEAITMVSIATLLLLFIACIVGPVFAVSVRRKLTTLGLLSASGAAPMDLFSLMLAEGVIIGVIGAAFGIVGSATINIAASLLGDGSGTMIWPWDVAIVLLFASIACGIAAAIIPAITTAKLDPIQALNEGASTRMRRLRKRHIAAPIVALLAGIGVVTAWVLPSEVWLVIASIAAIIGTTSLVLLAEKAATYLPLPARMATRDAVRNYQRTVPAVAAIAGTILIAIMLSELSMSPASEHTPRNVALAVQSQVRSLTSAPFDQQIDELSSQFDFNMRTDSYGVYDPDTISDPTLFVALPQGVSTDSGTSYRTDFASLGHHHASQFGTSVYVVDPNAPELLARLHPDVFSTSDAARAAAALHEGKAVVNYSKALTDGKVTIGVAPPLSFDSEFYEANAQENLPSHDFQAEVLSPDDEVPVWISVLVTPNMVEEMGLKSYYQETRVSRDEPLSFLESLTVEFRPLATPHATVSQIDTTRTSTLAFRSLAFSAVLWLTLSVILLVILLAAAESRRDTETMVALGASPSLVRRYSGAQGLVVGLLGTLAGTSYAVYLALVSALHFDSWSDFSGLPWAYIATVLVLMSALSWLIGLVFGARTRAATTGRRRPT
ncbi:ABC transporter permease [Corynebacterium sp.]|uniref:ABC transporter permease n=1 Tax=Corynebacterium sp. TaxID=1720 RepID=UPI0026DD4B48|nr:ABC transporter permease [Corynebacterium sp.]MDO5077684.1 hypothetical protein [Corynebacterium sp.]